MRYTKYIQTIVMTILFSSCSYLDFDETTGLKSKEDMYKYYASIEQMLTDVYSYMPNDLTAATMRDCGCDDAEHGNPASAYTNSLIRRKLIFRQQAFDSRAMRLNCVMGY